MLSAGAQRLTTEPEYGTTLASGSALVITDLPTRKVRFHRDPGSCSGLKLDYFRTKVVENGETTGAYYAVPHEAAAREQWPDLVACKLCS